MDVFRNCIYVYMCAQNVYVFFVQLQLLHLQNPWGSSMVTVLNITRLVKTFPCKAALAHNVSLFACLTTVRGLESGCLMQCPLVPVHLMWGAYLLWEYYCKPTVSLGLLKQKQRKLFHTLFIEHFCMWPEGNHGGKWVWDGQASNNHQTGLNMVT